MDLSSLMLDDNSSYLSRRHDANSTTITSTVKIRVTPRDDYIVSWGILWVGLFLASIVAALQVYKENRIIRARLRADVEQGTEAVSTADLTRRTFRRLLLLAMVSRLVAMPMMIWTKPLWLQFVGDTLPEMIFATAWTLMVTFFVQLVGSAMGGGVTEHSPSFFIQSTAYIVYTCLMVLELFNAVASVLLYAFLCVIYCTLLGCMVYFSPQLCRLLHPHLEESHRPLALRLYVCIVVCSLVFLGHMVNFALIVVAAPDHVYWWFNYGVLELIPAVVFLTILNPSSNKANRNPSPDPPTQSEDTSATTTPPPPHHHPTPKLVKPVPVHTVAPNSGDAASLKRVDSVESNTAKQQHGGSKVATAESALLHRASAPAYGSTTLESNPS